MPQTFENIRLTDVAYCRSTLIITVRGSGARIMRFALDRQPQSGPHINAALTGSHTIDIELRDTAGCVKPMPRSKCSG